MGLEASELILNDDGSIYHLQLKPEQLAKTIITVGDPNRVDEVTAFFDKVEFKVQKREFHTQTGIYKGKRISVVSTGIGTDNIDIVLNELDALANIDFKSREIKEKPKSLTIVRIGTSGAIQTDIPVDSFLISKMALGFDSLLHYYQNEGLFDQHLLPALKKHLQLSAENSEPYFVNASPELLELFKDDADVSHGITATNVGFYGPQGRVLRAQLKDAKLMEKLISFREGKHQITNLEMETSGIYGLSKLLGHRALSINAIIANRETRQFSKDPRQVMQRLIEKSLHKLATI